MKKLFSIFVVAAVVLIAATSCKKDDQNSNSLAGTVWTASGTESGSGWSYTWQETMTFKTASTGTVAYEDTDHDMDGTKSFTYVYNHPVVVFTVDGKTSTATINGNKMTLEEEGYSYTKQ